MNVFKNPYHDLNIKDSKVATRLQTYIPIEDFTYIFRDLHPGHGSVTTVMNILFFKMCEALRKNGIVDHATQRLEFEKFLVECELTVKKKAKKWVTI